MNQEQIIVLWLYNQARESIFDDALWLLGCHVLQWQKTSDTRCCAETVVWKVLCSSIHSNNIAEHHTVT